MLLKMCYNNLWHENSFLYKKDPVKGLFNAIINLERVIFHGR